MTKRTYDRWHTLRVHEEGFTVSHEGQCPTYPDGPESDDIGYGCPTAVVISYFGRNIAELNSLMGKEGIYRIQYWTETSPIDGEVDEGFDVERVS